MDVREKLVELVHNARMNALWHNAPNPSEYITDMLMEDGVTIQKWIPVTERLPEKITNKVIVLCKNGYRGFGHYENYKGKQTWYNLESDKPFTDWDLEDCESYEVTHWMPLPEPPKRGDDRERLQ